MKKHHYGKKTLNQSKFTLKKNIYLPQMVLQGKAQSNRSKEEALSLLAKEQKGKIIGQATPISDLNMFYNQIQRLTTGVKGNGVNYNLLHIDNNSKSNQSGLMIKEERALSRERNSFMAFKDKEIAQRYKTQNNSLIKNSNVSLNQKVDFKKNKQLQLKISLNYNSKFKRGLNYNYPYSFRNKYVPTSFITFKTQPSSTTHRNKESFKYKSSLQTIQVNADNKLSIEVVKEKKENEASKQKLVKAMTTIGNNEDNQRTRDMPSMQRALSISSHESKEASDVLEYEDVKDIIVYHDFSHINRSFDYLFYEDDYLQYLSSQKESYLQYFLTEKSQSLQAKGVNQDNSVQLKTIPIVKFSI